MFRKRIDNLHNADLGARVFGDGEHFVAFAIGLESDEPTVKLTVGGQVYELEAGVVLPVSNAGGQVVVESLGFFDTTAVPHPSKGDVVLAVSAEVYGFHCMAEAHAFAASAAIARRRPFRMARPHSSFTMSGTETFIYVPFAGRSRCHWAAESAAASGTLTLTRSLYRMEFGALEAGEYEIGSDSVAADEQIHGVIENERADVIIFGFTLAGEGSATAYFFAECVD